LSESASRALIDVDLAGSAKSGFALGGRAGVRDTEEPSLVVRLDRLHITEYVALEDTTSGSLTTFESMAVIPFPDVVDRVKQSVTTQSRRAASCLRNVVVLHRNLVALANHFKRPVVVAIAASRVRRLAIDVVVRQGDARAWVMAKNVVLATRLGSLSTCK
jgi:hypothetical protein